jgi:hypothetical protein
MNYIANARHAHNPKVEGSNPSPATNRIIQLHGLEVVRQTPKNPCERKTSRLTPVDFLVSPGTICTILLLAEGVPAQ